MNLTLIYTAFGVVLGVLAVAGAILLVLWVSLRAERNEFERMKKETEIVIESDDLIFRVRNGIPEAYDAEETAAAFAAKAESNAVEAALAKIAAEAEARAEAEAAAEAAEGAAKEAAERAAKEAAERAAKEAAERAAEEVAERAAEEAAAKVAEEAAERADLPAREIVAQEIVREPIQEIVQEVAPQEPVQELVQEIAPQEPVREPIQEIVVQKVAEEPAAEEGAKEIVPPVEKIEDTAPPVVEKPEEEIAPPVEKIEEEIALHAAGRAEQALDGVYLTKGERLSFRQKYERLPAELRALLDEFTSFVESKRDCGKRLQTTALVLRYKKAQIARAVIRRNAVLLEFALVNPQLGRMMKGDKMKIRVKPVEIRLTDAEKLELAKQTALVTIDYLRGEEEYKRDARNRSRRELARLKREETSAERK